MFFQAVNDKWCYEEELKVRGQVPHVNQALKITILLLIFRQNFSTYLKIEIVLEHE